ncbi:MAG: helix-turn-helix transcriptional regulator [Bacteroidales bacterium]|nr:helix-turn-helix transcriptional regulator [Bacteroidales bacterium]
MKARKNVHIGSEIARVVHEKGMSITEFASLICCHRKNVYDIFTRKSIDIDRLIRISEVLDYDFIREVYYAEDETLAEGHSEHIFRLLYKGGELTVVRE